MIWRSHRIVTGLTIFACTQSLIAAIAATTGSTFPDQVDMKLPLKHRGFSHWFPVYLVPALLLLPLFPAEYHLIYSCQESALLLLFAEPAYALAVFLRNLLFWFLIGALLHIMEDTFTGYIPVTSPKDRRSWYRPFYTGSPKENLYVLSYAILLIAVILTTWGLSGHITM
mgnify:CR=1 FL=1